MSITIDQPPTDAATAAPATPNAGKAALDLDRAFHVPWSTHLASGFVAGCPWLWKWLGNLETFAHREQIANIKVDRPIYIAGIARSGSTILLEAIAAHRDVGTHQYRDFPALFTPIWWNQANQPKQVDLFPTERAHGDGLMVTPASPEAMEESLWMAFFRDAHNPNVSQFLDRDTQSKRFEPFYAEHLRKLLHVRDKSRYVSKGNYNFTRLPYLQRMFPDAKCVVPIREPVMHIASLMKQHRLFVEGETKHPRSLAHMQRVGHYEFGLDRRPINVGDTATIEEIERLWSTGDEVRGWAKYWAHLYGWMADLLDRDDALRPSTLVLHYEDLCEHPDESLEQLLEHCELNEDANTLAFASQLHAPTYYRPKFTTTELAVIAEETHDVALRYGY